MQLAPFLVGVVLVIATLVACGEAPVEVTRDCPPPRQGAAIVFGEVGDVEGQAVSGADVLIQGFMDTGAPVDTVGECVGVEEGRTTTVTDDDGSYQAKVFSISVAEMCIAVTAELDGLMGFASGRTVELTTLHGECTPDSALDSVRVDVTLGR